jgi:TolB-like protein/DNA-binding winged helix-turn-helix (wHTH) protein/Tfp pilus assembly protein PilF
MYGQGKHLYEFGPFRIDSVERLLFRGQDVIPLTPKAVDTLLALVSNRGRVLEKEELIKLIWPDSFVEEGGLARNISVLRRVFEDGSGEVQYIETIPKRGYRFVAPVTEAGPTAQAVVALPVPVPEPMRAEHKLARRTVWITGGIIALAITLAWFSYTWHPGPRRINSLVVLPLHNPSNDPAQEYFTEGMTEELINTLAKIEALRVISRTSAMTYKAGNKPLPQIAKELNVDAVVEGSVLQSGGRVRITVQLFEAKTEKQLWAQSYDQALRDVLTLQAEVASAIANEIQVKLTPGEKRRLATARTVDPEAYLVYSYGRYYWNKRSPEFIRKGIEYFERAIAKDPSYAPPYAGLADAYAQLGSIGIDAAPPREVMPKAKAAALEAVKRDETLAEGHTSLAYVRLSYDWDFDAAEREFKRAIQLNPGYATAHHWYAHYFLARGQPEQALAEMRRAQALDPRSLIINMGVGWGFYQGRRYVEAIQQYRSVVDMDPSFYLTHCTLGMAYEGKHQYPEAIAEYKTALGLPGSRAFALAGLGRAYELSGQHNEARQVVNELENSVKRQYVPAVYLAAIYAAMNDKDQSIAWTRKAYDERSDYLVYLPTEPWADALRSDPRFQKLSQLIGPER